MKKLILVVMAVCAGNIANAGVMSELINSAGLSNVQQAEFVKLPVPMAVEQLFTKTGANEPVNAVKISCLGNDTRSIGTESKLVGTADEQKVIVTPYYKDAFGKWINKDLIVGSTENRLDRVLRGAKEDNYSSAKYYQVYATAEYQLSIPKNILKQNGGSFKGSLKISSEGYPIEDITLNCVTAK